MIARNKTKQDQPCLKEQKSQHLVEKSTRFKQTEMDESHQTQAYLAHHFQIDMLRFRFHFLTMKPIYPYKKRRKNDRADNHF